MCHKCFENQNDPKGVHVPTQLQVVQYKRHVQNGTVPKTQPKWITEHQRLTGQRIEPFKPDFRVVLPKGGTYQSNGAVKIPTAVRGESMADYIAAFDHVNGLKAVRYETA